MHLLFDDIENIQLIGRMYEVKGWVSRKREVRDDDIVLLAVWKPDYLTYNKLCIPLFL